MVTQTISVVKKKSVSHWHGQECIRLRHKRCDLRKYNHHHSSAFAGDEGASCSVANFIGLLMEIYRKVREGSTQMLVLASLKKVGLCCCIEVERILGKVLECLEKQSLVLQQAAFNFIETTTLEQLAGSTSNTHHCGICREKYEKSAGMVASIQKAAGRSSDFVKMQIANEDLDSSLTDLGCLKMYKYKLFSQHSSLLVHLLEKHILHLCLNGSNIVRYELFLRVIAPISVRAASGGESLPLPDHLIVCCLAAFSILLKEKPLTDLFIKMGGLEMLEENLQTVIFRPLVLRVLCVVVLSEVSKVNEGLGSLKEISSVFVLEDIVTSQCCSRVVGEAGWDGVDLLKVGDQAEYECDLWNTCLVLIKKSKVYQRHFQVGRTVQMAYDSMINLFELMTTKSSWRGADESQTRRFLKNLLNLVEVLLSICLNVTPFTMISSDEVQMVLDRHELIEDVKKYLLLLPASPADYIRLAMETLLNVAQNQSAQRKRKSEQVYLEAFLPESDDADALELDDSLETSKCDEDKICFQDDGYEADGELPDVLQDPMDRKAEISFDDNRLVYMELVQIVFEVLIKFANQISWIEGKYDDNDIRVLTSVINRLVTLARESVHNCRAFYNQNALKVVLQDFKSIFSHKTIGLRELQTNLLDLFVTIAQHWITSQALSFFFDLFKIKEPPFDLLLNALSQLLSKTSPRPEYFLSFSSNVDDDSFIQKSIPFQIVEASHKNTTSIDLSEHLAAIQHEHLQDSKLTPWSSAACVLPVQSNEQISLAGSFSVSLWLRTFAPVRQFFTKDVFRRRKEFAESSFEISEISSTDFGGNFENFTSHVSCDRALHIVSVGNNSMLFEVWSLPAFESVVLRTTTNGNSNYTVVSEVLCKSILQLNGWHHVTINYFNENESAKVKIVVDGHITFSTSLGLSISNNDENCHVKYVLVGNGHVNASNRRLAWYLGSLVLFKEVFLGPHINLAICALGPDSTNLLASLTEPDVIHFPTQPVMKMLKMGVNVTDLQESLKVRLSTLQDSMVLLYIPHKPETINSYCSESAQKEATDKAPTVNSLFRPSFSMSPSLSAEELPKNIQQTSRLLPVHCLHSMKVFTILSLDSAVGNLGGVTSMLLLLSRVIEKCCEDKIQAKAIGLTLRYCGREVKCRNEFLNIAGPALLTKLFSTQQFCAKYMTLKVIIDSCLNTPLDISQYTKPSPVVQSTNAVILDPDVLLCALSLWKIWEKDDLNIQIAFLHAIKELIRDEHPHHVFNRQQLSPNLITILLTSFKERLHDDISTISKEICHLLISLIGIMLKHKPDVHMLVGICKLLLLALPTVNMFIRDDGNNFFSLCSAQRNPFTVSFSSNLSTILKNPRRSKFWEDNLFHLDGERLKDALTDIESRGKSRCHSQPSDGPSTSSNVIARPNNMDEEMESLNADFAQGPSRISEDFVIISDSDQHSPPEIISGPEDSSSPSEEWVEVFSVDEPVEKAGDVDGISTVLCAGFLQLLFDSIENLPREKRSTVSVSVIKPELLLVFANNANDGVRTTVVKLLQLYLRHASEEQKITFVKMKGFTILANQIHRYPASEELANACLSLLLEKKFTFENPCRFNAVKISNPVQQGAVALIVAILPTSTPDIALCHNILNVLMQMCGEISGFQQVLVENSFVECIIHVILNVLEAVPQQTDVEGVQEQDLLLNDVQQLLEKISMSAASQENGVQFQTIKDIMVMLSHVEKQEVKNNGASSQSAQKIRHFQCACLHSAIDYLNQYLLNLVSKSAAQKNKPPDVSQKKPDMSHNHVNQRLHQLLPKAVDFLVFLDGFNSEIKVCDYEKSFTRYLIQTMIESANIVMANSGERSWKVINSAIWRTVKLQLLRLLVFLLNPNQPVEQRMFVVTVLLKEERPRALLSTIRNSRLYLEQKFVYYLHLLANTQESEVSDQEKEHCRQLMENVESCNIYSPGRIKAETRRIWKETKEKNKRDWFKQSEVNEKKIFDKYEVLNYTVFENVRNITAATVRAQAVARKEFHDVIKSSHNYTIHVRSLWQQLINQMTHERAVWHFPESYPQSWQLNPLEGPSRERRRLQRCHLHLPKKFFKPDYVSKQESSVQLPFSFLMEIDSNICCPAIVDCLNVNEKIEYNSNCTVVTPSCEASGEILVGNSCLYFLGEVSNSNSLNMQLNEAVTITWKFDEVKEILKRRYEQQDRAVEIFLSNGQTNLLAFSNEKDRNCLFEYIRSAHLPNLISNYDLATLTQLWQDGAVTNFDYLMQLNKYAGRSFNDLMQYPVFPFVLSNYNTATLNLKEPTNFRNFTKPMAIQNKSREQRYIDNYEYCKTLLQNQPGREPNELVPFTEPFHYGSHYSNSIVVLYFLVRMPPYTGIFLKFQDSNFDIPDRSFYSMETSWLLSSFESSTDMKELIPEMFYLPEMLRNTEGFEFGVRHTGEHVHDVILPPWCQNNSRLFVLIHRQALESDYVTQQLHQWIDLIFGFKQTGKAAVDAINVFHPCTYYGFNIDSVTDEILRAALRDMTKMLGQTPKQLFHSPHPMVGLALNTDQKFVQPVIPEVQGLKWGNYVGSPAADDPVVVWRQKQNPPITSFMSLLTNDVFGLAENCCLILSYSKEKVKPSHVTYVAGSALVTWGHVDGHIRIKLRRDGQPSILLKGSLIDPVSCCVSVAELPYLFVGCKSGIITAYSFEYNAPKRQINLLKQPVRLYGHTANIIGLHVGSAFGILLTSSEDGTCIIWDLTSLSYVRTIRPLTSVKLVTISNTSGDIALVSDAGIGSYLWLYTINGSLVSHVELSETIHALCFSSAPEGISVNVIATGMSNGKIRLWSTWDLKLVNIIETDSFTLPIVCLTYSTDAQQLYATNTDGVLVTWESGTKANKSSGKKPPKFGFFS